MFEVRCLLFGGHCVFGLLRVVRCFRFVCCAVCCVRCVLFDVRCLLCVVWRVVGCCLLCVIRLVFVMFVVR